VREDLDLWIETRKDYLARAALLAYFAYGGIKHLGDEEYKTWFGGITLAFHEMGHLLFMPLGNTLMILGGSITQLVIPIVAAWYLLFRQRDWFGFVVGVAWLGFSLFELATYVGDASRERLALVGFGGGYHHDWSTLLTRWHVLNSCGTFAMMLRALAFVVWLASLTLGGYIVAKIGKQRLSER
jgi:hypothetical protein